MNRPPDLVAPENDYRSVAPGTDRLSSLSVIVAAYGKPHALAKTLALLVPQLQAGDEAVVVDDGSEHPLSSVPPGVALVRQERDGFGLARARNLGLASTTAEVVVFLDADTIPGANFLARHRAWHAVASNLMVVGLRHHVDASDHTPEQILADGPDTLPRLGEDAADDIERDWRVPFIRRGARLTLGDQAFRAVIGNNLSVRRDRLVEVGGFSESFRSWGGEDTELAWRLWNSGMFVVPDDEAAVFHQVEPDEARGWRTAARHQNLALVADRVPHRFYRPRPHPFATVPKLTWMASAGSSDEIDTLWKRITATGYPDAELVWITAGTAAEAVKSLDGHSPIRVASSVGEGLLAARGELICFADARVQFKSSIVAKAVERLDAEPRSPVVRVPYVVGGDAYRRLDDLTALDMSQARGGAPLFALVRRREVLKDRAALRDPDRWWPEVLKRSRPSLLPGDWVGISIDAAVIPGLPGISEARAIGVAEAIRVAVNKTRGKLADRAPQTPDDQTDGRPGIDYVGFTEHDNMGDDAILVALERLLPWAEVGRDLDSADMLMLGGGTLINGNRYYLTRILRRDSPTLERAVFGAGVRDPDFHGMTEPMEEWQRFFDSSVYAGVRGPDSLEQLRKMGFKGDIEVLGDPALSLDAGEVAVDEDRVLICPVWTSGNLMGGDDRPVFEAVSGLIGRLSAEGRKVTLMSAFPYDDRHIMELMRSAGRPDLDYIAGYEDVDASMKALASAGVVVAERLHAAIMAAATGRPFLALEYWPKHRDFARSLDVDDLVISTDGITQASLWQAFAGVDTRRDEIIDRLRPGVERYRQLQKQRANDLRHHLENER